MLWKSVTALIVLFWVVMTTILVKHSYFTDEATAKTVSVNAVLQRIAQRQLLAGGSDTMQLLKDRLPAGDVSVGITRIAEASKDRPAGFGWHAGGRVTGRAVGIEAATAAAWSFEAEQDEQQSLRRVRLAISSTQTKNHIMIDWKLGDEMPKIEVTRDEKLIMDTKAVLEEAQKQGGGGLGIGGLTTMMPSFLGGQKLSLEHLIQMQAREEMIKIGDRKVRGSTLTLSALGLLQAKLRITEGGEIAEIELPNRWRALALLVLGLEPEVKVP